MWKVDTTHIDTWLDSLDSRDYDLAFAALTLLEQRGPTLGRPLADSVKGSRHKNMKELRPGSGGRSEVRILFAFDPLRRAIMLLAGDKSGQWQQWYETNIPKADSKFDEHLKKIGRKQHDDS